MFMFLPSAQKKDSIDVLVSITDGQSKVAPSARDTVKPTPIPDSLSISLTSTPSFQVVERVTIFVMDANDEKPEFQNMPAIIDVLEVGSSRRYRKIQFGIKILEEFLREALFRHNLLLFHTLDNRVGKQHLQSGGSGQRHRLRRLSHLLPAGNSHTHTRQNPVAAAVAAPADPFVLTSCVPM